MMERSLLDAIAAAVPKPAPAPAAPSAPKRGDFWTLPGFCGQARVTTSFGDLPLQALRLRDPLRTTSGNFAPVRHVDALKLDEEFLARFPDAQPILIRAGALGPGRPRSDILVSPHQRLGVGDTSFRPDFRMARDLLDRPGVIRRPEMLLTYYVFHCGEPQVVTIEGVPVPVSQ
jgi:hypothetical protein